MKRNFGDIFSPARYQQRPEFTRHIRVYRIMLMLLPAFFYISANGQPANKSGNFTPVLQSKEEDLGRGIFRAFQKKNDSLWVLLFPTNAEYRELTRLMTNAKIIKLPQATIDEMLVRHDNEATAAYIQEFHIFLKQADSLGIQWNDATYQKLDFNSFYPENFIRKYMSGDIWIACKNLHFIIEGIEAVEIPYGFRLQSIKRFRQVNDGE